MPLFGSYIGMDLVIHIRFYPCNLLVLLQFFLKMVSLSKIFKMVRSI